MEPVTCQAATDDLMNLGDLADKQLLTDFRASVAFLNKLGERGANTQDLFQARSALASAFCDAVLAP